MRPYVVPDDHVPSDWPMTPMPDPAERELSVTMGAILSALGESPVAGTTGETAQQEPKVPWFRRVLGRR